MAHLYSMLIFTVFEMCSVSSITVFCACDNGLCVLVQTGDKLEDKTKSKCLVTVGTTSAPGTAPMHLGIDSRLWSGPGVLAHYSSKRYSLSFDGFMTRLVMT